MQHEWLKNSTALSFSSWYKYLLKCLVKIDKPPTEELKYFSDFKKTMEFLKSEKYLSSLVRTAVRI